MMFGNFSDESDYIKERHTSILVWLRNNDTSNFSMDNHSQSGVIIGSKMMGEIAQPAYEFMAIVLDDIENRKYKFIILLWTIIVPIIFSLIIVLGILGNVLVIYVIMSHAYMRTYTHVLLLNLAIADVSFLVCCVPFQAHKYASISWQFGDISCKIIQYLIYVTLYVTIWTLASIAIVRYYVVVRSQKKIKHTCIKPMIIYTIGMWIVISIINIPTAIFHEVKTIGYYTYCGMADEAQNALIVSLFTFGYAIPLVIIVLAYSSVLSYLLRLETGTRRRTRGLHASKGILTVVVCFLIAWLPFHIQALISAYGTLPKSINYEVLRVIWHALAYSNSVVNPIIYNYVCKDFRNAFRHVLVCRNNNCAASRKLSSHSASSPMTMRTIITPRP